MSKLLPVAVLLVALAASAATAASAGSGGTQRPFKGALVGSVGAVPDPGCPLGVRSVSEGSGRVSHLGRISFTSDHCFALPNLLTQGRGTLAAANGDELRMTYEGTADPPIPTVGGVVTGSSDHVFVGGTGRFADAIGKAHFTALIAFAGFGVPSAATWTFEGTLSY